MARSSGVDQGVMRALVCGASARMFVARHAQPNRDGLVRCNVTVWTAAVAQVLHTRRRRRQRQRRPRRFRLTFLFHQLQTWTKSAWTFRRWSPNWWIRQVKYILFIPILVLIEARPPITATCRTIFDLAAESKSNLVHDMQQRMVFPIQSTIHLRHHPVQQPTRARPILVVVAVVVVLGPAHVQHQCGVAPTHLRPPAHLSHNHREHPLFGHRSHPAPLRRLHAHLARRCARHGSNDDEPLRA